MLPWLCASFVANCWASLDRDDNVVRLNARWTFNGGVASVEDIFRMGEKHIPPTVGAKLIT